MPSNTVPMINDTCINYYYNSKISFFFFEDVLMKYRSIYLLIILKIHFDA